MALRKPKKPKFPKKPKTRDWIQSQSGIKCFPSKRAKQTVAKFWETVRPTAFHTSELARATKEINRVLEDASSVASRPESVLSFIAVGNRLLLVWAEDAARPPMRGMGSDAKISQIAKALKLDDATNARRRNNNTPPITYRWEMDSSGHVTCIQSEYHASCQVTKLWQTARPTAFRPRELMQVTAKLQRILDAVARSNSNLDRKLSIIIYDYRPMLVWTTCGNIGPDDELPVVQKALGLKLD